MEAFKARSALRVALKASAAALVILVANARAGPAEAHAILVRSVPDPDSDLVDPPPTIEMWFSEPLEQAFTAARLIDSAGQVVPTEAAIVDPSDAYHLSLPIPDLGPGIYTVAWQTLSQVDGHEWFGSFPITVLNPDGSRPTTAAASVAAGSRGDLPSPDEAATRWLALSGGMLLFGSALFLALVVPGSADAALNAHSRQVVLWIVWIATAAILLGSVAQVLLQALRLSALESAARLLLGTRTGTVVLQRVLFALIGLLAALQLVPSRIELGWRWPVRAGLAGLVALLAIVVAVTGMKIDLVTSVLAVLIAGGCLALIGISIRKEPGWQYSANLGALTVAGTALLFGFSSSSHAGAVPGSAFAVAGDFIHLVSASVWVAGLVVLALLWRRVRIDDARSGYSTAVSRFSRLAGVTVFVVIVTGLFSGLVELPSLESLWTTPYGRVLLVKLAIVAIAMGVAFFNNRKVKRSAQSEEYSIGVGLEAAISLVLLIAVSVLVQTPAPRSLEAALQPVDLGLPYNSINPVDDLNVHLQVNPNQSGVNRFWTHFYHDDGSDIGEVQLVRLYFEYLDQNLGRSSADLEPLGLDAFEVEGAYFSQAGRWRASVYLRRRGLDDILLPIELDVAPGVAAGGQAGALSNPVPGLAALTLVGGLFLAIGVMPFLWRGYLESSLPRSYSELQGAGAALLLVGAVSLAFGLSSQVEPSVPYLQRVNPFLATDKSITRGGEIFEQACQICHGPEGRGDGPVGVTLNPRPSNLAIHTVPGLHADGQLLEWVSEGFPGGVMPGFADAYSEEDLWHTINFIRTFARTDGT